jgi:hypothetical protein
MELLRTGPKPPIMVMSPSAARLTVGGVCQRKEERRRPFKSHLRRRGARSPLLMLMAPQFKCGTFHGGKSQELREWSLEEFKERRYDILVPLNTLGTFN